jgi:hypothetical protein
MLNNKGKTQPQPFEGEMIKREVKRVETVPHPSYISTQPSENQKDTITDE